MTTEAYQDLTHAQSRILKLIKSFTHQYGESQCSVNWIADKLKLSASWVRKSLKKLFNLGLIQRVLRDGRTTVYRVVDWILSIPKILSRNSWECAVKSMNNNVHNQPFMNQGKFKKDRGRIGVEETPPHIDSSMNANVDNKCSNEKVDTVDSCAKKEKEATENRLVWEYIKKELGAVAYYLDENSILKAREVGWQLLPDVVSRVKWMQRKSKGFLRNPSGAFVSACKSISKQKRLMGITNLKMAEKLSEQEIEILKNLNVVEEHRLQASNCKDEYWYSRNREWRFHVLGHKIVFREKYSNRIVTADATSECFTETLEAVWAIINSIEIFTFQ